MSPSQSEKRDSNALNIGISFAPYSLLLEIKIFNIGMEHIMGLRKLERTEWKPYFDTLSKSIKSSLLNLEVVGAEIGDQREISWQPLNGFSHDVVKDRIDIFTENLGHSISHPKEVFVQEKAGIAESIEIIDEDDNKQILKFRAATKWAS